MTTLDGLIALASILLAASIAAWLFLWKVEFDSKTRHDIDLPAEVRLFGDAKVSVRVRLGIVAGKSARLVMFAGVDCRSQIVDEATAVAIRLMGFWGLRYQSPDQAMAPDSVADLECALTCVTTDRLSIATAIVYEVSPVDSGPPAIPDIPEEPPEETDAQRMRRKYSVIGEVVDAIKESVEAMGHEHPDVFNDPDLADMLKEEIRTDKRRAAQGDRPAWNRRHRRPESRNYRV